MSECKHAFAHYVSNTGYRFITKKKTCYSVSVPTPCGGYEYRSIGYIRLGEKKALRKATKIRNEIGKRLWGRFWERVRTDFTCLARLPRSLEPRFVHIYGKPYYVARYTKYDGTERSDHYIKVSVSCHGKLAAWGIAKRKIEHAHRDVLDLLSYMDRASLIKLE